MTASPTGRPGRIAWALALPLLVLVAGGILMPFAWRSGAMLASCLPAGPECAARELLADGYYARALGNTVWLSAVSTLAGLAIGGGAAIALAELPAWRRPMSVLVNLGANFAGVPLALALTLLLGVQGVATSLVERLGGALPFDLLGNGGLLLAFVCFQAPLACLMLAVPVQMLDPGLKDACATLGAGPWVYWRRVGLPLLMPSLVEVASLLFANAAAAYATPFALSGTAANVLVVRIAALVSGDIFAQPELSSLLALVLFAMLALVIVGGRAWATRLRRRMA